MCINGLSPLEIEETEAHLATLNREELCEFMVAMSQNLLDELNQIVHKAEQENSSSMPLLVATRTHTENIFGEEYFKALETLNE